MNLYVIGLVWQISTIVNNSSVHLLVYPFSKTPLIFNNRTLSSNLYLGIQVISLEELVFF